MSHTSQYQHVPLADILQPVSRPVRLTDSTEYRCLGVKWYAQGVFIKEAKLGAEIAAARLYAVQDGDFIYNRLFAWKGSFAFVSSEHAGCVVSGEFPTFRVNEGLVSPRYVYAFFRNQWLWDHIARQSSGTSETSRLRFKEMDLLRLKVALPSLAQQRRIVEILDNAENLRSLRQQADRRTTQLIPALFHELFGDSLRNPQWTMIKVRDAGNVQLGRQRAPKYQSGAFTRPYVRVANVFEDRIDVTDLLSMDFDERDFASYRLKHGDILLNEGQSTELVGRPAIWRNEVADCCFQNTLIRFTSDRSIVEPEFALAVFLFYFRNGEFAKLSSKTSNVAHLGVSRFVKMPFPLPPLALQKQFASTVTDIRAMQEQQVASRRRLDDLFQSLLHRAFRGEL